MNTVIKLHLSVLFGWGIVAFGGVSYSLHQNYGLNTDGYVVLAAILISLRYGVLKTNALTKNAYFGWMFFSVWESIYRIRNGVSSNPVVFFTLIIIGVSISLLKGIILASILLCYETYQLAKYYLNKKKPEQAQL